MKNFFKQLWQDHKHRKAMRIRHMVKRMILIDDARAFFAGQKTQQESWEFRQNVYARIDGMSDDEICKY